MARADAGVVTSQGKSAFVGYDPVWRFRPSSRNACAFEARPDREPGDFRPQSIGSSGLPTPSVRITFRPGQPVRRGDPRLLETLGRPSRRNGMEVNPYLEKTVIDCSDPRTLAMFHAGLLGMQLNGGGHDWVAVGSAPGRELVLQSSLRLGAAGLARHPAPSNFTLTSGLTTPMPSRQRSWHAVVTGYPPNGRRVSGSLATRWGTRSAWSSVLQAKIEGAC